MLASQDAKKLKANKDNIFIGAKIILNDEIYFAYKINAKTLYYGKEPFFEMEAKYKKRAKGIVWKDFCETNHYKLSSYENILIDEKESARKKEVEALSENKETKAFSSHSEKVIHRLYDNYKRGKSYRTLQEVNGEIFNIVKVDASGQMIISKDYNFYFYDMENNIFSFWRPIIGTKKKSIIPWPRTIVGEEIFKEVKKPQPVKRK